MLSFEVHVSFIAPSKVDYTATTRKGSSNKLITSWRNEKGERQCLSWSDRIAQKFGLKYRDSTTLIPDSLLPPNCTQR